MNSSSNQQTGAVSGGQGTVSTPANSGTGGILDKLAGTSAGQQTSGSSASTSDRTRRVSLRAISPHLHASKLLLPSYSVLLGKKDLLTTIRSPKKATACSPASPISSVTDRMPRPSSGRIALVTSVQSQAWLDNCEYLHS